MSEQNQKPTGIRERILTAPDARTIGALLEELKGFDFVSAKTVQACHNAARRRTRQLQEGGGK